MIALRLALVFAMLVSLAPYSVVAQEGDMCPEPNNEFQRACLVGLDEDVRGILSSGDDVDTFHIRVLDFNTPVRWDFVEAPPGYRLTLSDWRGQPLQSVTPSEQGRGIDYTVATPGAYYLLVDSATGQVDPSRRYLGRGGAVYANPRIPIVGYSTRFAFAQPDWSSTSGNISQDGSTYTINITQPGSLPEPTVVASGLFHPSVADIVLAFDTRVVAGSSPGYGVFFRRTGLDMLYLTVKIDTAEAALTKQVGSRREFVARWTKTSALDQAGGVNRTVVVASGPSIRVFINGALVIDVTDGELTNGNWGTRGLTWSDAASIRFDNLVMTSNDVAERYDQPGPRILATSPTSQATFRYADGEYHISRPANGSDLIESASVVLAADAIFRTEVRIVGELDQRYAVVECRVSRDGRSFYRLSLMPGRGMFRITKWLDNQATVITEWRTHEAIRRGSEVNAVELRCVGSEIVASVNGQHVAAFSDDTLKVGFLRLGAAAAGGAPVDARFQALGVSLP